VIEILKTKGIKNIEIVYHIKTELFTDFRIGGTHGVSEVIARGAG